MNWALRDSNINWIFLWRLPIQNHSKPSITEKRRSDLSLWRRPAWQTLSNLLDISSVTARVAPDLLRALAILPDTTVRRSAVDWEDVNHTGNQKKGHISLCDQQLYYL